MKSTEVQTLGELGISMRLLAVSWLAESLTRASYSSRLACESLYTPFVVTSCAFKIHMINEKHCRNFAVGSRWLFSCRNFAAGSRWLFRRRNFAAGSRWLFCCRNFAVGAGGFSTAGTLQPGFSAAGTSQPGVSSFVYVAQSCPSGQKVPMEVCDEFK